ncbi:hypothetical protein OG588_06620 [Streptomyces prunicolor]|uniref:hypothetical protein n=1 Tax=Streptomyces prunicolor TaxID=67348 RepID=UPI003864347F|nr:hypothetical protein OG588_06620 [Streptomyces prunicolor]
MSGDLDDLRVADRDPGDVIGGDRLLVPKEQGFAAEPEGYTAIRHQHEVPTSCFDLVSTVANPGGSTVALTEPTEAAQFH